MYAPNFPKQVDEGWWLVLGDTVTGELLALKRISAIRGTSAATLAFVAPEEPGAYEYTLYLMSDSYMGLDQQCSVPLRVYEPCALQEDDEMDSDGELPGPGHSARGV